jgi:O-antigen/teichoic acid export membrane protein
MTGSSGHQTGPGPAAAGWWQCSWARAWSTTGQHGQGLVWVLGAKLSLIGANAALTLTLANVLELEIYGVFVAAIGLQLFISRGILLGVETGLMRLQTLPDLVERSPQVGRAGLVVIAATTAIVSLGALPTALVWSWPGFPRWGMAVVVGGALGTALVDYGYHYRLAGLQFRAAAGVQVGTAAGRTLVTGLAAVLVAGHAMATFLAYAGFTVVCGFLQAATVVRGTAGSAPRDLVWRLVRYSAWLGVANMLVVLSLYEGTFLLLHLQQPAAASVFGLALTLSLGFFALYNAFYEYGVARIVRIGSPQALRRFVLRSGGTALALSLASVPIVGIIGVIIPYLVRGEYAGVETVFFLLAASMLVLVFQAPLEVTCHALLRPHLVLLAWALRVIAIAVLMWRAGPESGPVGAAFAQLGGGLVAAGILLALVVKGLWELGRGQHGPASEAEAASVSGEPGRGVVIEQTALESKQS